MINGTIREKDMLYEVNHPLIVNLLAHGQDEWVCVKRNLIYLAAHGGSCTYRYS